MPFSYIDVSRLHLPRPASPGLTCGWCLAYRGEVLDWHQPTGSVICRDCLEDVNERSTRNLLEQKGPCKIVLPSPPTDPNDRYWED